MTIDDLRDALLALFLACATGYLLVVLFVAWRERISISKADAELYEFLPDSFRSPVKTVLRVGMILFLLHAIVAGFAGY